MVSNARLDFPDPDRPVTTVSRSRGISSEMFRRLWTRAPWMAIVVRADPLRPLFQEPSVATRRLLEREKRQLLHRHVAHPREAHRRRRLSDSSLGSEVFARSRDTTDVEVPLEVVLDLGRRSRVADLAQILEQRGEDR